MNILAASNISQYIFVIRTVLTIASQRGNNMDMG
jgi:hypothetical protein